MNKLIKKVVFKTKKHSPELLLVTGLVAGGATVISACKGTTKASQILEESKKTIEDIHQVKEDYDEEKYSEQDFRKDLAITYVKTGGQLLKAYAPALIFGSISVASILGGYGILKNRYVAVSSAYAAVHSAFNAYRGNVVEKYGEKVDNELYFGTKEETIEVTETDEKGKEKKSKKKIKVADPLKSPYTFIFDASSRDWKKEPSYNLSFLEQMEDAANRRLEADGYFFLNDALDLLDIPRTKAGCVTGWINDPNKTHQISFGLTEDNDGYIRLRDGYEASIWLDFNVQGNIYDQMPGL